MSNIKFYNLFTLSIILMVLLILVSAISGSMKVKEHYWEDQEKDNDEHSESFVVAPIVAKGHMRRNRTRIPTQAEKVVKHVVKHSKAVHFHKKKH